MPRKLVTAIFIACEGTNTEPIYFEQINEVIEDDGVYELTIYPDKNKKEEQEPRTDAIGLISEAHNRADVFDQLWVVFDKNGYTLHRQAFELARQVVEEKQVQIGFSSIAFEQWVLLHFERSDVAFRKSQDIIDHLIAQNYYADYEKKADIDIYTRLKDRTWLAIRNAGWLRMRLKQKALLPGTAIYELNPFTNLDVLIKCLFDINLDTEWNWLGNPYPIGNITYTLTRQATSLQLSIYNRSRAGLMIN